MGVLHLVETRPDPMIRAPAADVLPRAFHSPTVLPSLGPQNPQNIRTQNVRLVHHLLDPPVYGACRLWDVVEDGPHPAMCRPR